MAYEWIPAFLAALTEAPNVAAACRAAAVTRKAAYDARKADPEFAAGWDDALESAVDELAGEAWRRAKSGYVKGYAGEGENVVEVRAYSDQLAMFLLKAHRKRVYGGASDAGPPEGEAPKRINIPEPDEPGPGPEPSGRLPSEAGD